MPAYTDLHWVAPSVPVTFKTTYEINGGIKTQRGKEYAQKSKAQQEWN